MNNGFVVDLINEVFPDITQSYITPDRFYHDINHINYGFGEYCQHYQNSKIPAHLLLAWYFHLEKIACFLNSSKYNRKHE